MSADNGGLSSKWENTYRGAVIAMFTITLTLLGIIYNNITTGSENLSHRVDILGDRINGMDGLNERVTRIETQLQDLRK